jgi:hypothetical protein
VRRLYGLLAAIASLTLAAVCIYAIWRYWGYVPGDYRYPSDTGRWIDGKAVTSRAEIVQAQRWSILAWACAIPSVLLFIVAALFAADDHDQEVANRAVRRYRAETERIRARTDRVLVDRLWPPDPEDADRAD